MRNTELREFIPRGMPRSTPAPPALVSVSRVCREEENQSWADPPRPAHAHCWKLVANWILLAKSLT